MLIKKASLRLMVLIQLNKFKTVRGSWGESVELA